MAWYIVTNNANTDWSDEFKYKFRYESRDGEAVAQEEVERRRARGEPVFLWRWEQGQSTLVEQHNA